MNSQIDFYASSSINKKKLVDFSKSTRSVDYNIQKNRDKESNLERKTMKLKFLEDSSFQNYYNCNNESRTKTFSKLTNKINEPSNKSKNGSSKFKK